MRLPSLSLNSAYIITDAPGAVNTKRALSA